MAFSRGPKLDTNGLSLLLDSANQKSYPGSGNSMYDLSPNKLTSNLVNGATSDDVSIKFDGVDDRCITSSEFTVYGNNQTWSAWIKRYSSVNTYNMFMGRYLPYFAFRSSGQIHFSNNISGQKNVYTTTSDFVDNVWYNVVFITEYDGTNTTMSIFINGVFNNSGTFTGTQGGSSSIFTLGDGRNNATWYPFNGEVSHVCVYDRTLSSDEIYNNYISLKSRFES